MSEYFVACSVSTSPSSVTIECLGCQASRLTAATSSVHFRPKASWITWHIDSDEPPRVSRHLRIIRGREISDTGSTLRRRPGGELVDLIRDVVDDDGVDARCGEVLGLFHGWAPDQDFAAGLVYQGDDPL
jgi:hypothetical protein